MKGFIRDLKAKNHVPFAKQKLWPIMINHKRRTMSVMRMPILLPIRLAAASAASSPAAAAARAAHRPLDGAATARRSLHDHHSQQRWRGCCITASSFSAWPHLGPSAKLLLLPRGFAALQRRELSGMVDVDGDRPALQITERCAKVCLASPLSIPFFFFFFTLYLYACA